MNMHHQTGIIGLMNGARLKCTSVFALALLCGWCLSNAEPPIATVKTVSLERIANDRIFFALSPDGRKFELGFASEAASVSGDRGLFDMMVGVGQRREWGIVPEEQTASVTRDGKTLIARYARLRHAGTDYNVQIELRFTLEDDGVICEAQLDNQSDITVEEFWFPWVGPFRSLGPEPANDTLILPHGFGRRVKNPAAYVEKEHTGYMAPDQKRVLACSHYPGGTMTMGWFGFYGGGKALGLLSLDDTFQTTGLNIARDTRTERLSAGFARYPFQKRGFWRSPRSLVRLHHDDWHADARAYRQWADAKWWSQTPRPGWVEQMHGWQRIILKHQYGEIFYRYRDLVDVYEGGRRYGITTLFVFGWFKAGMDNDYPNYEADDALGGAAGLREAIAEVQRRGGRVILYANGHLIDTASDYYRDIGKRICLKTAQGGEYREAYKFAGDGTYLREFGARDFVLACQATPEWRQKLIEIGQHMASFGPDGIFFDQMGGRTPYLCFDPTHPHAGPALAQGPGKDANLAAMRKQLIAGHPGRTFGTELVSDCLDRNVDFVHVANFGASQVPEVAPEVFRYTFPEILCSTRGIRDERDHEKRMNWAFLFGWRFDVEIWRCRGDLRQAPAYGAYMAKLIALRNRWPGLLMTGRFVDEDFFAPGSAAILAKGYTGDGRAAIVAWNHTSRDQPFTPKLKQPLRFVEGATLSGPFRPGDSLPGQSLAVLIYEK
jgi:hypothetical protein